MFSQNLSFGMMLQSSMNLQLKYDKRLPPDFPHTSHKLRLEYLLTCNDFNQKLFRSSCHGSESGLDEQVTFNENDKTNFLASQEAYEEIHKLKAQVAEKDVLISSMEKQIQKIHQLESIQYKYDLQTKRVSELQANLRSREDEVDKLMSQVKKLQLLQQQREHSREQEESSLSINQLHQHKTTHNLYMSPNQPSTPQNKIVLTQMAQRAISTARGSVQHASKCIDMPLKRTSISTIMLNSHRGSCDTQDQYLSNEQIIGVSSYNNNNINVVNTSQISLSQHHQNLGNSFNGLSPEHMMMRCKTQAEMIEQLIKDKEKLQTGNPSKLDHNKQNDQELQSIEKSLRNLYQVFCPQQRYECSSAKIIERIREEMDQMRSKLNKANIYQSRFSSILDKDIMKSVLEHDQSIQLLITGSPRDRREDQKQQASKLVNLEKQISQLQVDLNNEKLKSQQFKTAFHQIESIFRQESQEEMEPECSDQLILKEIKDLNQKYIVQYVEVSKQNDLLKQQIEILNQQYQQIQEQLKQQALQPIQQLQSTQHSFPNNAKINQFKRNTAIKKVQGFFQNQMSTGHNLNQQQLASGGPSTVSLAYSDSTCSSHDILYKSQKQSMAQLHKIDETSEFNLKKLNEQVNILEKEKQLLNLELKSIKDKHEKEISELNVFKDLYDEEKQLLQKTLLEQDELRKKLQDLQEQFNKIKKNEEKVIDDYNQLVQKYESQKGQLNALQQSCQELKNLIEEERQTYNDDRERYEEDLKREKQLTEAKQKILKTKLIPLYEGSVEQTKQLTIEDLIDHLAMRIAQSNAQNNQVHGRRVTSLQARPSQETIEASHYPGTTNSDYDSNGPQDQKIVTSHQLHRRYSCLKPQKVNCSKEEPMLINQNSSNSREQYFQLMATNNNSKDSLLKTSLFGVQDPLQMTKIIELNQVTNPMTQNSQIQGNQSDQPEDFIKSNISPIKKNKTINDIEGTSMDQHMDQKENRIISVDHLRMARDQRRVLQSQNLNSFSSQHNQQSMTNSQQNHQLISQQNISMKSQQALQGSFLRNNSNHQSIIFPIKQLPTSNQVKEMQPSYLYNNAINKRKPLHLQSQQQYDMPLQIKPINSPQVSLTSHLQPVQQKEFVLSPSTTSLHSTLVNKSQLNKNENLNSIIESFRREKNVFNQKFLELKQKLETFNNSPQRQSRDQSSLPKTNTITANTLASAQQIERQMTMRATSNRDYVPKHSEYGLRLYETCSSLPSQQTSHQQLQSAQEMYQTTPVRHKQIKSGYE
ncbi:UNKNOWN [Stylonychia lemnae]|uniref:Uncharacterized protein n=1 Tax=Stylonychia lemnae TaxID=5949 RepID=A0A078ATY2_STYLE|nr:UNKNOWN [Stylonychia lemnae]|eukprot:CDW84702.1 UNKNOWN [Stylonychia lemnae]